VFLGLRRFDEMQANLGVARNILQTRLTRLVEHGVLEKRLYQEHPPRYEYRLTEKGLDLWPVLASLLRWGDRWMSGKAGPPVELRHKECDHVIHPELACPECGDWLVATDMRATPRRGSSTRTA
jgi:DNA-binding HxlR family transcriptional regulator